MIPFLKLLDEVVNPPKKAQEKLSNATGFGVPPNQCIDDH